MTRFNLQLSGSSVPTTLSSLSDGNDLCHFCAIIWEKTWKFKEIVEQRTNYEADEYGLHWEDIDEDLSFEGFFDKRETTQLYKLFMAHPELNVSAIARRLGISQSLMAQYISGKKKASAARVALIMNTVREIGQELIAV